jgi:hypothetical protein
MSRCWRNFRESGDRLNWLLAFLVVFSVSGFWALSSPYYASPDEPAHAVRAYAVAHGQLTGTTPADPNEPGFVVRVPAVIGGTNPACFAFQIEATGDCEHLLVNGGYLDVRTSAGRHPPLYYGVVGLPTWITGSGKSLLLMRLWSGALSGALLASTFVSARNFGRRKMLPVGILLAVTPMSFFLFGSVNPNGLEIAAAIAVWVNGLILITESRTNPRILSRLVVAASVLTLTRQLGPLWLLLIGGTLLVLAGRRWLTGSYRDRKVQISVALIGLAVAVQVAWLAIVKPLDATRNGTAPLVITDSQILRIEVSSVARRFTEAVGVFGWRDTSAPAATFIIWFGLLLLAVVAAWIWTTKKVAVCLTGLVLLVITVPVLAEFRNVRTADFFWQGRYTLPLIVGIPIVSMWALESARTVVPVIPRRGWVAGGIAIWFAQFLAFAQAIRRYTVGYNGTIWFWTQEKWHPFLPSLLLLAGQALLLMIWIVFLSGIFDRRAGRY